MQIQSICKTVRNGSGLAVNIPLNICEYLKLERGDIIKITWEKEEVKEENKKEGKQKLPEI